MATQTSQVVPTFDFTDALRHSPEQRIRLCLHCVRDRLIREGIWDIFGVPPIPESGATEAELRQLESELGVPLPDEYRQFLRICRFLVMDDGRKIWGLDHQGVSIGRPWLSDEHRSGVQYLVFSDYWNYADGDQLMFDLSEPEQSVVAYLHEHGPLYEEFAPSFSLALWRMVQEPS